MGVSPAMIFKYGCHNHSRSVVLAGPRLAPLRMRGSLPMTLSGGCDMHVCLFHGCAWFASLAWHAFCAELYTQDTYFAPGAI